ncbi:unnamed protein product [Phaedon cochleariae]|uniref:Methyltransferase type 12 domain-containing protein n=1 Tax=Phaedon cochleariae TaxID=80249 RepID=A0A9P0DCN3_PHACE|nr:unnamed protein product [Phaedon cochleariae]
MNNPELYTKNNHFSRISAKFILDKYGKWMTWKDNERIMEFGVGCGNTTKEIVLPRIPSNFAEYVAVDINKKFVNMAKSTLAHDTRFQFMNFDIESNEVPLKFMERFDHILSFLVIHWTRKPRKAFENLLKMLRSDGEIFLMFVDKSPIDGALEELGKNPRWAKYGHENFISPYYHNIDPLIPYRKDMIAAGIDNPKIGIEKMLFCYKNVNHCTDHLCSVNPILHLIPEEEQEDYKRDYMKHALRTGGFFQKSVKPGYISIGVNYNLMIVYAKKLT